MDDNNYCNTGGSSAENTGSNTNCKTDDGVYDMIGNVWEWTNEYIDGYGRADLVPQSSAYVYSFISGASSGDYDEDYYWFPNNAGDGAFIRGGGWYLGANSGAFALRLSNAPSDAGSAVGFRCCQ